MLILKSKELVAKKEQEIRDAIKEMKYEPRMVIFQVGNDNASNKYIDFKLKKAASLGINAVHKKLPAEYPEDKLIEDIKDITPWVDGIIVQLPLPKSMNKQNVLDAIAHTHDIDGLATGNKLITPATPKGIISLLNHYNIDWTDKVVAVVGQSKLVGKPTSDLFESRAKEVIRLNSKTGLKGTERADILVVAAGKKDLIKKENIKEGVIIIDVGVNKIDDNKITGDVDRQSVGELPSAMSPVVGGVGPMTVISLFENLINVIKNKN